MDWQRTLIAKLLEKKPNSNKQFNDPNKQFNGATFISESSSWQAARHRCRCPRGNLEGAIMAASAATHVLSGETGPSRYLEEIKRFPMLEPQEEFMVARRWREHGDRDAAHKLVNSHLRLVAKIAMSYRGYGLPIPEVLSEGNVGLMQAVQRFEPDKGFRLATYAMWWIRAAIQEYILRSWSLVKMGTTANQKKLFFNLRKAKSRISALEEGDMRPDQVKVIAKRLGVTEQDVIDMNRRLGGDASLNAPIREDGDSGEWMDWLVDDSASQESRLAAREQSENRHKALSDALSVLNNRERRIFEARRLVDDPITLEELADEFGVSRERVRQIETRAFEKLQKAVRHRIAAMELPEALEISNTVPKLSATRILGRLTAAHVRPSSVHRISRPFASPISPTDGQCYVAAL
jgi:RNA polymerase sigma-32 factor